MKKLIDIPDGHIESLKNMAKEKRQSVKAYMESAVMARLLSDVVRLSKRTIK